MWIYLVRLLLLAFVLTICAPLEQAQAQEKSNSALTKKKKKQNRKKRKRRKKRAAAKKKQRGENQPAPVESSPFEDDADSAEDTGKDDSREELDDQGKEADGGSEKSDSPGEERGTKSRLNLGGKEDGDLDPADGSLRRSGRMEFDERLVKGQAAKSGAVYLFKRMPRRLPGLIPLRRSYRRRIVEPVLGLRPLKPAVFSNKDTTGKKIDHSVLKEESEAGEIPPESKISETDDRESQ